MRLLCQIKFFFFGNACRAYFEQMCGLNLIQVNSAQIMLLQAASEFSEKV
jgi:hypothetical protein